MSDRIPALTGVRGIAALLVVLTHAAYWTGHYTADYGGQLFARLELGVAIFFVLSGYLLFRPWVQALREGSEPPPVGRYFWHRARRILPAYWITVIAVYLVYAAQPLLAQGVLGSLPTPPESDTGTGWGGFLRNMTFTQVYGFGHLHGGLTQMWSLAAEVAFYLLLPVLAWFLPVVIARRRWRPDLIIAALLASQAISPAWSLIVAGSEDIDPTARLWAPAFIGWFFGGMLLAALAPILRSWSATASVAVGIGIFLISGTDIAGEPTLTPSTASATIVKHLLFLVAALALVAPLAIGAQADGQRPHWWRRLCGSRPVVWLGEISYELFCVHVLVLELTVWGLGYEIFSGSVIVAFVLTTAISIPIAWALHIATRRLWQARTPAAMDPRTAPVRGGHG